MTEPGRMAGRGAVGLLLVGSALCVLTTCMIFAWTPIEATQGVIQRIYYVHIPVAWVSELGFGVTAVLGIAYLWLRDDRLDAGAVAAAEGGLFLACALLVVGPLWARVAWGTWWTPDPRLNFTLLLFFIFVGYFMLRGAVPDPDKAKRLAAVVAVVGALDIPLIHMSVYWFRSLHPEPVVLRPEGPQADPRIVVTLLLSVLAYTLVFIGLWRFRYSAEILARQAARTEPQLTGVAS